MFKKKIPCLGICHGAQFIASFFDSKIFKKKGHVLKNHEIITTIDNKILRVNSFHNYCIVKLGMQLNRLPNPQIKRLKALCTKFSLMGIMWHPERNKTFKNFDKSLIKKVYMILILLASEEVD